VQLLCRFQEVPLSQVFQLIHTHLEVTGSAKAQVSPGFINYAKGNDATQFTPLNHSFLLYSLVLSFTLELALCYLCSLATGINIL